MTFWGIFQSAEDLPYNPADPGWQAFYGDYTSVQIITNLYAMQIQQDPLWNAPFLYTQQGSIQVWEKQLANGQIALAMVNRDWANSGTVLLNLWGLGVPTNGVASLIDCFGGATYSGTNWTTPSTNALAITMPAYQVNLWILQPNYSTTYNGIFNGQFNGNAGGVTNMVLVATNAQKHESISSSIAFQNMALNGFSP